MTLCIIPARGGSKGIPYKNVVLVAGHPLVAWSIRQALASKAVDDVVVSTDCDEVAAVAEDEGAHVFWRSAATATDDATSESCLLEVLRSIPADDVTVFLQATSPLRQPGDIDAAVTELHETGADSVFSACRVEGYCWAMSEDGLYALHGQRQRRQDRLDTVWQENGSIYVFRTEAFLADERRHCGRVAIYEMDSLDSFQIDEPEDIGRLEQLMAIRLSHGHYSATTHP